MMINSHMLLRRFNSSYVAKTVLSLNLTYALFLFRIIQECLQNCLKHAEAAFVNIGFTWYPDQLQVRVRDDRKGFDPEATFQSRSGGLGLQNIRNRAHLPGIVASVRY